MATFNQQPVAKAEMLIRRPAAEVFGAFIDPAVTTKFWFTKSSGKLERGKKVRWDWEMYGVHADVEVKEIEENRRIVIEWPSTVEWTFTPRGQDQTLVRIKNSGFQGDGDEIVKEAIDSAAGFNIVICGLKALLERGLELNFIADAHPDSLVQR